MAVLPIPSINKYWKIAIWFVSFETLFWGGGIFIFETIAELFSIKELNWLGIGLHTTMLILSIWCFKNFVKGWVEVIRNGVDNV